MTARLPTDAICADCGDIYKREKNRGTSRCCGKCIDNRARAARERARKRERQGRKDWEMEDIKPPWVKKVFEERW